MQKQPQPRLLIAFGLIVIIIVGAVLFALLGDSGKNKATIAVDSVPEDLTLTLDGKKITNMGDVKIDEGKHTLKATRDGFATEEKQFEIKQGEKQIYGFYLKPITDEALRFLNQNPDQVQKAEGASSAEFDRLSKQATEKNPIISQLPIVDNTFRIDYGNSKKNPDEPGAVALYIEYYTTTGQEDALNWMRTFNYNPADYEIIFIENVD